LVIYVRLVQELVRAKKMMEPREAFMMYSHILLLLLILMDQFVNISITSSGLYRFIKGGLLGRSKYLSKHQSLNHDQNLKKLATNE
jgi:hypothetical protein